MSDTLIAPTVTVCDNCGSEVRTPSPRVPRQCQLCGRRVRQVRAMLPKPAVVALDNPHGTNWQAIETGLVEPGSPEWQSGNRVWVTFQSAEGWQADYGYREEPTLWTYWPDMPETCPPRVLPRGWTLWAN